MDSASNDCITVFDRLSLLNNWDYRLQAKMCDTMRDRLMTKTITTDMTLLLNATRNWQEILLRQ